jgi:hypothetical protein
MVMVDAKSSVEMRSHAFSRQSLGQTLGRNRRTIHEPWRARLYIQWIKWWYSHAFTRNINVIHRFTITRCQFLTRDKCACISFAFSLVITSKHWTQNLASFSTIGYGTNLPPSHDVIWIINFMASNSTSQLCSNFVKLDYFTWTTSSDKHVRSTFLILYLKKT